MPWRNRHQEFEALWFEGKVTREFSNAVYLAKQNKQTKLNQPTNHHQQNQEESVENRPAGDALRKEGK